MYVIFPSIVSDPDAVSVMLFVFDAPSLSLMMYILPSTTEDASGSVIFLDAVVSTFKNTKVEAGEIIRSDATSCLSIDCKAAGLETIEPPDVICTALPELLVKYKLPDVT